MTGRRPHPVLNIGFPGCLTAVIVASVYAVIWPWMVLHGAARWAMGITWTALEVAVLGAVIAAKVRRR